MASQGFVGDRSPTRRAKNKVTANSGYTFDGPQADFKDRQLIKSNVNKCKFLTFLKMCVSDLPACTALAGGKILSSLAYFGATISVIYE